MSENIFNHEELKTKLRELRKKQLKTDVRLASEFEEVLSRVADEIRSNQELREDWDKFFLETADDNPYTN